MYSCLLTSGQLLTKSGEGGGVGVGAFGIRRVDFDFGSVVRFAFYPSLFSVSLGPELSV